MSINYTKNLNNTHVPSANILLIPNHFYVDVNLVPCVSLRIG